MQRGRTDGLTIGQAARRSGLPASTIRFYEAQGIVTPGARTEAGYRLFTDADIRRLVLARQARSLGLALPQVTALVAGASSADCGEFAQEFRAQIAARRASVAARIAELRELEMTLTALQAHIDSCVCPPGMAAVDCVSCLVLGEGGGEDCDSATV